MPVSDHALNPSALPHPRPVRSAWLWIWFGRRKAGCIQPCFQPLNRGELHQEQFIPCGVVDNQLDSRLATSLQAHEPIGVPLKPQIICPQAPRKEILYKISCLEHQIILWELSCKPRAFPKNSSITNFIVISIEAHSSANCRVYLSQCRSSHVVTL